MLFGSVLYTLNRRSGPYLHTDNRLTETEYLSAYTVHPNKTEGRILVSTGDYGVLSSSEEGASASDCEYDGRLHRNFGFGGRDFL